MAGAGFEPASQGYEPNDFPFSPPLERDGFEPSNLYRNGFTVRRF